MIKTIHTSFRWLLACLCLFIMPIVTAAPTPITFWHSMSGQLGDVLNQIIKDYNNRQSDYQIISIYKGEYAETLTSTVAAFRAKQQPDLVQIFEVGTASMLFPKGAITPIYSILKANGKDKIEYDVLPVIHSYYSDDSGRLAAVPFNCSSPVMYYNRAALQAAGVMPSASPMTWPQFAATAQKLLAKGYSCGFTTAWPSWIQLESFCAWHNIPFASDENGFKKVAARMVYDSSVVENHLESFAKWQKQRIFQYGGRNDEAQALFTSGKCPILFESSGARPGLIKSVTFPVGIAPLPYWPGNTNAPQNTSIGGGAIWALSGHSDKVNAGIADFVSYLLSTPVQVKWQGETGYLPVTQNAVAYLTRQGYYLKNPEIRVVIDELAAKPPTIYSRGIRLGNFTLVRQNNDTALEEIWSGKKTARDALTLAIKKNNLLVQRFSESVE